VKIRFFSSKSNSSGGSGGVLGLGNGCGAGYGFRLAWFPVGWLQGWLDSVFCIPMKKLCCFLPLGAQSSSAVLAALFDARTGGV